MLFRSKSWWRDRTAHRPLDGTSDWGSNASSSPPSSPRSPRLFGTDASGGETSDENEDLRMKTMRDRQTAIENSMSGLAQKLDILLEKMGAPAGQITATSIPATSHVSSLPAREAVSGQARDTPRFWNSKMLEHAAFRRGGVPWCPCFWSSPPVARNLVRISGGTHLPHSRRCCAKFRFQRILKAARLSAKLLSQIPVLPSLSSAFCVS